MGLVNLSFHQTFGLNFRDIGSLVKSISKNPYYDNFEISEESGIGIGKLPDKGKVLPTIKWADYAGIIEVEYEGKQRVLKLSPEGKILFEYDPYFQSTITAWFVHYNLSKPPIEKEKSAWHFLIQKFLPGRYEFTRKDLIHGLEAEFPDAKIKSINPGVLLNSYIEDNAMNNLNIIEQVDKNSFRKGISNIPNPFVLGFIFAKIWEREYPNRMTIPFGHLNEPNHLLSTMNISEDRALNYLAQLKNEGIYDLNKVVMPFDIMRHNLDSKEILKLAFEESGK